MGGTNPLRAQPIDVRPGTTVPGIDIPLAGGTVRQEDSGDGHKRSHRQPAPGLHQRSAENFHGEPSCSEHDSDANGKFTIRGLTSEGYNLHFRTGTGRGAFLAFKRSMRERTISKT
jgi:hypothetical protein